MTGKILVLSDVLNVSHIQIWIGISFPNSGNVFVLLKRLVSFMYVFV